jgi:hypothetical protein
MGTVMLYLSPTQLSMFFGCAAAYYQRYILGRKIPPGIALVMGSGLDAAANVNFTQKQATRIDLPISDFEDAAATEFDERVKNEGLLLTKEEASRSSLLIGESKDKSVELARKLCTDVAPRIQPIAVQAKVCFERDAVKDVAFEGFVDVVDESHDVIDVKSSKNKWQEDKASSEEQPTFYLKGARETLGTQSEKFTYHIITKGKTPQHQVVDTTRDESDLVSLDNRANVLVTMRKAGLFPPTDPGSWRCGPMWCGYYLAGCPFISKRKKMAYINREDQSNGK